MKSITYITVLASSLVVLSCGNNSNTEIETEEKTVEVVASSKSLVNDSDSLLQCSGEIGVPPEAIVSIYSMTNGLVKTIKLMDGEAVKKGQVIATIEHLDIVKLQEEYLKSKNEYTLANQDLERKQLLFKEKSIPKKDLEISEANLGVKQAQYQSLKKQIQLIGLSEKQVENCELSSTVSVVSPINGYVTKVKINKGAFVTSNTEMFELIDDTHKHAHLQVFSNDVGKLKVGQKVAFTVAGSNDERVAEIYLIGKAIDMENKAVHVHCHLKEEDEGLIIGSTVFATIKLK